MEVKVFKLGPEKEIEVYGGLKGPCLSVAITSKFVAASSGDGKLRIWEVGSKEVVKEIECFPKTNSFTNAEFLCNLFIFLRDLR